MSDISERYTNVSAQFTERVTQVPAAAWDNPAPCEGWVARDVVRHLVEWLPAFFYDRWEIAPPDIPSVDRDPAAAWAVLQRTIQAALDDVAIATRVEPAAPIGPM